MAAVHENQCEPAALTLASDQPLIVERESELVIALEGLSRLMSGDVATLARGPKHYVKAVRHDEFWAVTTRGGGYFTLTSFTAALTTEHSEREMRSSRNAESISKRIRRSIVSPSPEKSLSTAQVQTLFAEFFAGKRFSIPQSGA